MDSTSRVFNEQGKEIEFTYKKKRVLSLPVKAWRSIGESFASELVILK
jgi:hypothetical protein